MFLFKLLLAVLLTELLVELGIKSLVLKRIRNYLKSLSGWTKELLSCGYCFSVWVGQAVAFLTQISYNFTGIWLMDTFLMGLVLHRLSNILHNVVDKHTDKYYSTLHVNSDHEEG